VSVLSLAFLVLVRFVGNNLDTLSATTLGLGHLGDIVKLSDLSDVVYVTGMV